MKDQTALWIQLYCESGNRSPIPLQTAIGPCDLLPGPLPKAPFEKLGERLASRPQMTILHGFLCFMCVICPPSDFELLSDVEIADSETVMVDLAFGDDFYEQNRSWDDFGPKFYRVQDAGFIDGSSS